MAMNIALLLESGWIFHSPENIYEGPSGGCFLGGLMDLTIWLPLNPMQSLEKLPLTLRKPLKWTLGRRSSRYLYSTYCSKLFSLQTRRPEPTPGQKLSFDHPRSAGGAAEAEASRASRVLQRGRGWAGCEHGQSGSLFITTSLFQ